MKRRKRRRRRKKKTTTTIPQRIKHAFRSKGLKIYSTLKNAYQNEFDLKKRCINIFLFESI